MQIYSEQMGSLINNKQIVSSLDADANVEDNLAMNIAIELYGQHKGVDLWIDNPVEFKGIAKEKYDYYAWEMMAAFMSILEIEGLSFMSWDYISSNEGNYTLIVHN